MARTQLPSRCQSLCQGPRPPPLLTLNVITPSPVASPNFSWKVPSESQKVGFAFLEVCTFRSRWPRPSDCGTGRDLFEMSCPSDNPFAKAKLLRWVVLGGQSWSAKVWKKEDEKKEKINDWQAAKVRRQHWVPAAELVSCCSAASASAAAATGCPQPQAPTHFQK